MIATTRISVVSQFSQGCAGSVGGCPTAVRNESSGPARKRLNRTVVQTSASACIDHFVYEFEDHRCARDKQTYSGSGEIQPEKLDYNPGQRREGDQAQHEK